MSDSSLLESYLLNVWYGARAGYWLRPLGGLYALAITLRRRLYDAGWLRSRPSALPVIVVGNLTVGGTGKTPLVIWLVEHLREQGRRVAVVSRGYGGDSGIEDTLRVSADTPVEQAGDEPLLIARRTGAPVYVDRDRVRAVATATREGAEVVVSDDGLQHLRMARAAEVVVVDGVRRFGNERCLPAGPLREPMARLQTVDAVLVNGEGRPGDATFELRASHAVRVSDGKRRPLGDFAPGGANAVAAIGHPARFATTLAAHGVEVHVSRWLRDHATLRPEHLRFDNGRPVLVTEKDAVKLGFKSHADVWYVPVLLDPSLAARDALGRITAAVGA